MIEKTDAKKLFSHNLDRTNMLFEAIDKIRAYDRLYRMKQTDREYLKIVEQAQDTQFEQIQRSCGEHAIISLATLFETYYKEFLQQILSQFSDHFTSKSTKYSSILTELIGSDFTVTYELIEERLKLRNRFGYYELFQAYDIDLLASDEKEIVEYIYMKRNNYVHNAGRIDTRIQQKLVGISPPYNETMVSTEAKRLRTKLCRIIYQSHDRIVTNLDVNSS